MFKGTYVSPATSSFLSNRDIGPDGKRFLMIKEAGSPDAKGPRKINIVVNWFEELKEKLPVD